MYRYIRETKFSLFWYICSALMHFINTGIEPSGGEMSKDKLMASFQFASAWPQKIEIILPPLKPRKNKKGQTFVGMPPKYLSF